MKCIIAASCILCVLLCVAGSTAASGGIRHIKSHDNILVVTDPSKGTNSYPQWTAFPTKDMEYRKVVLWVTYACPDSLHCGEWDYIDNIMLRRVGGQFAARQNIELARMISPYGWRYDSDWSFTWHVDITDFAFLLHDSVEIEFIHTGYESNTDRGWKVTLDFEITEGRPAMQCLGMDTLWCGSFPFGDTSTPIESLLMPISFTPRPGADIARLRIHQTGHGMDDSANCAEFCRKYRQVFFDSLLVDQRFLWRECGDNPLYPQAGTWIFDRANWCPGAIVYPDQYDFAVTQGAQHTVNIDMEPYVNPNTPSANWYLHSYLLHYTKPWAKNDVSIEEIVAPSNSVEHSRLNPVCGQARIVIKNQGSDTLRSLHVRPGFPQQSRRAFAWSGVLAPQATTVFELPGEMPPQDSARSFVVTLEYPNGHNDEYPADNRMTSTAAVTAIYPTQFVLAFRTNRDSSSTSYQITDVIDIVMKERVANTLAANTLYYDTINLPDGCYQLAVEDTAGDGLDFWFNAEGGYGYVRLLDMNGRLMKAFGSDFGSGIEHWFTTADGAQPPIATDQLPLVYPFPIRNPGTFTLELFFNDPTMVDVTIVTEDSSRTVFQEQLPLFKDGFVPIDISKEPDGFYFIEVTADGATTSRKIKVKHEG